MQTPNSQFSPNREKTREDGFQINRGTADGIQLFFPADVILSQGTGASFADATAGSSSTAAVAAYSGDYPGTRTVSIQNLDSANAMRIGIGATPTATSGYWLGPQQTVTFKTDLAVNVIRVSADVTYARNAYTLN